MEKRHVHMTGKSETACEYLASFVVAMLSAVKRQKISDGTIKLYNCTLQAQCR